MTFTLRANRQTIASRLLTPLSVATSLLGLAGALSAQEPVKPPATLQPEKSSQSPLATDEAFFTSPPRDILYRVDSEATKIERFRQLRKASGRMDLDFPDEDAIRIKATMTKREFQPTQATMQASYVVYQPLYFQQINVERYGWDLGVFQPVVSAGQFYGDVLLFPYKFASNPPWHCTANAGYALPGDPEPLRFLTTPFSWRGVAAQAGVAVGGAAIFP